MGWFAPSHNVHVICLLSAITWIIHNILSTFSVNWLEMLSVGILKTWHIFIPSVVSCRCVNELAWVLILFVIDDFLYLKRLGCLILCEEGSALEVGCEALFWWISNLRMLLAEELILKLVHKVCKVLYLLLAGLYFFSVRVLKSLWTILPVLLLLDLIILLRVLKRISVQRLDRCREIWVLLKVFISVLCVELALSNLSILIIILIPLVCLQALLRWLFFALKFRILHIAVVNRSPSLRSSGRSNHRWPLSVYSRLFPI